MEEKSLLPILLGEFRDKMERLKELVQREVQFPDAPNKIKVVIGMRRAGKTYFVYQRILELMEEGVSLSQILYLNFEDDRLLPLDRAKLAKLIEAFYSFYPENYEKHCFLFLDEIQNVEGWPIVIRRFHDSKDVEIYLTGSSAKLLSKEIATSLRGRSLSTEIWPFSFREFLRAKKVEIRQDIFDQKTKDQLMQAFREYLSAGGFPEVTHYSADIRQQTLQEYLDIVLFRDIIERHQIKHSSLVKQLLLSMIHNVSSPFSIHKFYNEIKGQGYKIGKDAIYEYVEHIEDAYFSFPVSLYNRSLRRAQANPKKLYAIDPGMVRAVTLDYESDLGKLFENVVYLDLRRLGCQVQYYLTEERYEIDFLATSSQGRKKLFQVTWNADAKKTAFREQRALEAGMLELDVPGEIITLETYLQKGVFYQ